MGIIERKQKWREGPYQGYACELVEKDGRRLFHTAVDIGWWPEKVRYGCMGCGNGGCKASEVTMNLCWPPAGSQCDWQTVGREQCMASEIISS